MDSFVFAAVLFAAAAHAGWNATIKRGLDPLVITVLIAIGAGAVAVSLLPLTGLPAASAWPWVLASVVIHLGYFVGLIEAYRTGDMSQVYPIARGSAPLLTATISTTWLGEALGLVGWMGLLSLVSGVFLLSLRGSGDLAKLNRWAVSFALFTALTICAYSVVDGVGARVSGNAHAYTVALFIGNAVVMALYGVARRGARIVADMPSFWITGVVGGALQLGSYGIAIWAMTVAPIAIVAALRETSVLFGALIAIVILKEQLRAMRIVAALLIVAGLMMIKIH